LTFVKIDPAIAAFIQEGLPTHIATRNALLEPSGARVTAVTVDDDLEHVTVYVPTVAATPLLDDLRANGQVAVVLARPIDERSCQVKGVFVDSWTPSAEEESVVGRQWEQCVRALEAIGYPRATLAGWLMTPCVAVRFRAEALFSQTPGPGAGARLP
jgi:hypothetical protein